MNIKAIFGGCCGCFVLMIIISFFALIGTFASGISFFTDILFNNDNPEEISTQDLSTTNDNQIEAENQNNTEEIIKSTIITVPETEIILNLTGTTTEFGSLESDKTQPSGTVTVAWDYIPYDENAYITVLAVNSGGSGTQYYLTSLVENSGNYLMKDTVLLGDRIQIEDIYITGNQVIAVYKTHGKNQAMTDEPNTLITDVYQVTEDYQFTD